MTERHAGRETRGGAFPAKRAFACNPVAPPTTQNGVGRYRYDGAEIAAVTNYVIHRFGNVRGQVTASDI
jgi:hypothetical protein